MRHVKKINDDKKEFFESFVNTTFKGIKLLNI